MFHEMHNSSETQIISRVSLRFIALLFLVNAHLSVGQELAVAKNAVPYATSLLVAHAQTDTATTAICPAQLGEAIATVTNRPQFSRGRWGILIQSLSRGETLYSRDAQKYFVPASNVKLLTTAAALQNLGTQFRIRTSVYRTSDGGLRVIGRGDPSLTDTQLLQLAQQVNQQGIRQVSQVIVQDDYFRGPTVNPIWEWEDLHADYGAPVNSLMLNQNAVKLTLSGQQLNQPLHLNWSDPQEAKQWQIENQSLTTVSASAPINITRESKRAILKVTGQLGINSQPESVSLAVVDPVDHFVRHFQSALVATGIRVAASTTQVGNSENISLLFKELAFVESPPLTQLLKETNQNSNNLYAEALLRLLGARVSQTATTDATADLGLRVVKTTLTKLGVDPSSYMIVDGSGLSRHNLVSPEAIASTLRAMAKLPTAAVYRASLPVAGVSGTLQNRFRNTAASGIVQAKTGTMSGVVALSGYIDPLNYEPLVFSLIVNQSDQPATTIRQAVDEIVLLLTRLRHC